MEAEKYHDLPSVSWGHKRASGVIRPRSEVLGTRGHDGEISVSGQDKMRRLSSSAEAEKRCGVEFLLPPPFAPSSPQQTECVPGAVGRRLDFTESTDSNVTLIGKYPHRQAQKSCFTWVPVASQVDIKSTITGWITFQYLDRLFHLPINQVMDNVLFLLFYF